MNYVKELNVSLTKEKMVLIRDKLRKLAQFISPSLRVKLIEPFVRLEWLSNKIL